MNTREQIESLLGKFVVITIPNAVKHGTTRQLVLYRRVEAVDAEYDKARGSMDEGFMIVLNEPISTHDFSSHGRGSFQKSILFSGPPDSNGEWHGSFVIREGLQVCLKLVPTAS